MNKKVLVTGSSRGIGRGIALAFAKNGYDVVINCLSNTNRLEEVKKEIEAYGVTCIPYQCNVGVYEEVESMFRHIEHTIGPIDILINNAGISHIGLLDSMTPNEWDQIISTNLSSVFYCSKLALPSMISKKEGKIINISSVWGSAGASCEVAYSATKGGIDSFTKALAKEVAPCNVQVNAIALGAIDTEMNHFLEEEEKEILYNDIPTGRFGTCNEVGEFVHQIATSSSYLTGQVIKFDGGWI